MFPTMRIAESPSGDLKLTAKRYGMLTTFDQCNSKINLTLIKFKLKELSVLLDFQKNYFGDFI